MKANSHEISRSDLTLRLKTVFESAVDGIIIIDEQGSMEEVNPAGARMFGYEVEELIGKKVNILMPLPYSKEHDGYMKNYHETGVAKIIGIGREVVGLKKNGEVFPFWLSVSKVVLEEICIYTGFIHDLTQIKQAEKKLQTMNDELEDLVMERTYELERVVNKLLDLNKRFEDEIRAHIFTENLLRKKEAELTESLNKEKELGELKSRFVSMASHEFRTPLSTILSSVALLSRYTESDQQSSRDKHLAKIKTAVNHLTGILNDFLSISKFDEGKIRANPEAINTDDMVKEIYEEMKALLKPGQVINLNNRTSGLTLFNDPKIIKNIFLNLLSNAIKYSKEGSEIFWSVDAQNGKLYFEVRDQGIGIPEEDQKYLFDRFFRASNATNIEGTGLGLNIVKKYLELLGGHITFKSVYGTGTTFNVEIPMNLNISENET